MYLFFHFRILYSVYIELSIIADDSRPYLQYLNTSTIGHLTIADSPIERAEIFVIMYVETIKNGSHEGRDRHDR
jgi:hypothetical protein